MERTSSLAVNLLAAALIFATTGIAAEPASPSAAPELVQRWSALAVGPATPVAGLTLSAGHLTLVLSSGSAAYVTAGDGRVGVFFRGEGTMTYVSADPVEHPILRYNVSKNTGLEPVLSKGTATLGDRFTRLLWIAGGAPLPDLPGKPDPSSAETPNALAEGFADHRQEFERIHASPLSHQLAAWQLNGPEKAFIRAEISGGKEDLLYLYDDLDDRSESLQAVHKVPRADPAVSRRLYLTTLSEQPIGRDRRDPVVPRYLLTNVDLSVTASDGNDVSIGAEETFGVARDRVGMLTLSLYDTRFARDNLGHLSPRRLRISRVLDETGRMLPFDHDKDEVVVQLPAAVPAGGSIKVRFEIQGDILFRPGGDSYWELGVEPWFPQPDLAGQYYNVHCKVRVKKPFVPFAPGKTLRRETSGDENVLETRVDRPVQFMVVLAGKYAFEEETRNGITVRVASYGGKDAIGIRKLTNLSHKIIDYYAGFLGPFPFEELNVVEISSWGFGQAPPGFMFITSEAFNPIGGGLNQLFSKGVNERFAHEIAHQYWGHVVKMATGEEQWITESFAEICAGLFVRELLGKSEFQSLEAHWRSRASESSDTCPIPLANRLRNRSDSQTAFRHRTSLLYSKGPWVLNAVRREIGDRPFLVFLSSCQSTFRWKFGSTRMVPAILEVITKRDWKPFFEAHYWGTGMP